MKYLIFGLLIHFNFILYSQNDVLCAFVVDDIFDNSISSEKLKFSNSQEASVFVEVLLSEVGLPMNFHVKECNEINCTLKRNAYAKMNKNGTRFIVYDNAWFSEIDNNEDNILSLTILSHEIGHHLAAHTIQRNFKKYKEACKYCKQKSKLFNQKVCDEEHSEEYKKYLANRRTQELQADRFAGFIMNYYGAKKQDILNVFKVISKPKEDSLSTHPRQEKRLKAAEEGFDMASDYKKDKKKIDINDIKRLSIDIDLKSKTKLNRNKLISDISKVIRNKPIQYIRNKSDLEITSVSGGNRSSEIKKRIQKYTGSESLNNPIIIDEPKFEYFRYFNLSIQLTHQTGISYNPHPALHIKDDELRILLFEEEIPTIIYRSNFDRDLISLKEIETSLIEIYNDGISNKLEIANGKN